MPSDLDVDIEVSNNPSVPSQVITANMGFAVSHDYLFVTTQHGGKTHVYRTPANVDPGQNATFSINISEVLDKDPAIVYCHVVHSGGIIESPDPIVNIRQSPPPTQQ